MNLMHFQLEQLEKPAFLQYPDLQMKFHSQVLAYHYQQMATASLMRMSGPLGLSQSHIISTSISSPSMISRQTAVQMCLCRMGISSEHVTGASGSDRKRVSVKTVSRAAGCLQISEKKMEKGVVDTGVPLDYVYKKLSQWRKFIRKEMPWRSNIQMLIEKVIMDCRFFTLLAIAGSLLGSALCFVEGGLLILESYLQYFHALPQMAQQGHVLLPLIEAIDMFLMGTAMLNFGMALHVMFMGQQNPTTYTPEHTCSFHKHRLSWIGVESAVQAKSKIGHAFLITLQVQVLEKFTSIPVTNCVDLAFFAGAVFLSSVSIFILSRS